MADRIILPDGIKEKHFINLYRGYTNNKPSPVITINSWDSNHSKSWMVHGIVIPTLGFMVPIRWEKNHLGSPLKDASPEHAKHRPGESTRCAPRRRAREKRAK